MQITKRFSYPILVLGLLAMTMLIIGGCNDDRDISLNSDDLEIDFESENGKDHKDMEHEKAFLNDSVPPLDLKVPVKLETATLGMG